MAKETSSEPWEGGRWEFPSVRSHERLRGDRVTAGVEVVPVAVALAVKPSVSAHGLLHLLLPQDLHT